MSTIDKPWGKIVVNDDTGESATIVRDRRGFVMDEDYSLDPGTMCGSHFLVMVDGVFMWKGVVVGEPQAGQYLCHLDKLEEGAESVQRVFTLDTMLGGNDRRFIENSFGQEGNSTPVVDPTVEWRFYDSEEKAVAAYQAHSAAAAAKLDATTTDVGGE